MNKTFIQKNLTTILIVGATLILGGIAVFTAIRLYQLRSEPVAPNVPESVPQAANEGVVLTIPIDTVAFGPEDRELATQSVTQYSGLVCTVTATARNQESVHPNNNLIVSSGSGSVTVEDVEREAGGTISANGELTLGNSITVKLDMGPDGVFSGGLDVSLDCNVPTPTPPASSTPEPTLTSCTELAFTLASATASASPSPSPSTSPSASPSPSPSATASPTSTPAYSCNSTCTTDSQCQATDSHYVCYAQGSTKTCRHEDYPSQSNCQPAPTSSAIATPTPASLPQAGVSAPTILGLGAGILLLMVALAFAL